MIKLFRKMYSVQQKVIEFKLRKKEDDGMVFMFHKITEMETGDEFSISVFNFEKLIEYIVQKGVVISSQNVMEESKAYKFLITFDDADESVYKMAYPILKKYNIPFTVFVAYKLLGKEGYISESMLQEMAQNKQCKIGFHSYSHQLIRFMDEKSKLFEILEGKEQLEKIIGYSITDFAFPYGSVYAVDKYAIMLAKAHYEWIYMTWKAHFSLEELQKEKIFPRKNINDKVARIMFNG